MGIQLLKRAMAGSLLTGSSLFAQVTAPSQGEFAGTNSPSIGSTLQLQGTDMGKTLGKGPSLTFMMPANVDGSNSWEQARILSSPDNTMSYSASGRLYLQVRDNYDPGTGGAWNWRTGLMIAANGNIGIGTTNPQYKLSVNGTIQAKEIFVNTGWADYVFQPHYRVTPLPEVAAFIKTNHHLPNIPSESEVKENGVSLGDMQSKLLAKIEELTLQVIQLDQKNTTLTKRVAKLQAAKFDKPVKNGGR